MGARWEWNAECDNCGYKFSGFSGGPDPCPKCKSDNVVETMQMQVSESEVTVPNKYVFILRGLPGTGKSILANVLANSLTLFDEKAHCPVIDANDYFIDEKTKAFNFDKTKLKDAYEKSFEYFKELVGKGERFIIINNTNIKQFHYYHYLDYAQRHNYLVSLIILPHNAVSNKELSERNIHSVDQNTIRRMRKEFEWEIKEQ
jgi:predicted kinase